MKQYISDDRAMYEDNYHGQFSKKLAEFAIAKMKMKNGNYVTRHSIDDVLAALQRHGAEMPDKFRYTAWYLWHMAIADYPNALPNEDMRAYFVYETIMDPDGCPANVLDCFVTKMCNAGEIIFWEEMI